MGTDATPVRVRWLGTAGFALECEGHTILIDPYLTRASLARCLVAPLRPDPALIGRYIDRADAVVAGHTHFDHVLDVPAIALRTGARVYGSRSAANLCRAAGVPDARVHVVEREAGSEPAVAEVGPFRLRFVPSAHSRFLAGRVPSAGEIEDCDQVPLRAGHYRCGAVFGVEVTVAGRVIYHVGSANLVEASGPPRAVDLVLACVAGWTSTPGYPERLVRALSPRGVLLSHWDDFFRPLAAPARALPLMKMPRLYERLTRASRDVRVGTLPLLGQMAV